MPLPISTSAATRGATKKFLFLPLLPLTAHLVHLLQHRLRPFLQRLSKLPRLQALLLLLLLLLQLQRGLEEEFHRAGVHCFGCSVRQHRCGEERHPRSPVRQDCVQQLRLGILQDSRPRPPVATVFSSRRTTCDNSTTLRRVVECSGNCSGDADLLVSPPRAHPPLPPPHRGSWVTFNMARNVSQKSHPAVKRLCGGCGGCGGCGADG